MKSYFFNAEPTTDLISHPTGYDREYDADDHAAFFAPFLEEAGVLGGKDPDACKVVCREGTTLGIMPGFVYVRGRGVEFDGSETVTAFDGCRVVARMNKSADVRAFQFLAVPELVRTEDIYDLELARAAVSGGTAAVTDTRTFLVSAVRDPMGGVGKSLAGQTVEPVMDTIKTAGTGAEIFNDYRERIFDADTGLPARGNIASGAYAHAEGFVTTALGAYAHAEGAYSIVPGSCAHAEGYKTIAATSYTHAEGRCTATAAFMGGHTEGLSSIAGNESAIMKVLSFNSESKTLAFDNTFGNPAKAFSALVIGGMLLIQNASDSLNAVYVTVASIDTQNYSITVKGMFPSLFKPAYAINISISTWIVSTVHAEGCRTVAFGDDAHSEGSATLASGSASHAEGMSTTASGTSAHAEGTGTTASGTSAHAEGTGTTASGTGSHAGGVATIANNFQHVVGTYNVESLDANIYTGDRFIVGGGSDANARKNAFRVNASGACYGSGAWNTSGADYAELFEWADGNPEGQDRAGLFVTLDGEYIRLAGPEDDYILGIVSAAPSVVGDVYDDQWAGMYLRDVFGRTVIEMQDFPAELGPDGEIIRPARREPAPKLNPDYDHTVKYQPRTQRLEWDAVGLLGKLVAVDDGTCQVNGWCTVGKGGVATRSGQHTKYRVMARLDESHIRVLIL